MSVDANDPNSASLIGFWDFVTDARPADKSCAEASRQNGRVFGDAFAVDGGLFLDGRTEYFSTLKKDDPFDLRAGTVSVCFVPAARAQLNADVLIQRGDITDHGGTYFAVGVTGDGRIEVTHTTAEADLFLRTPAHIFKEGDRVAATYAWTTDAGGSLVVTNLDTDVTQRVDFDTSGLKFSAVEGDGESFALGARDARGHPVGFNGVIDHVAVYDRDIINQRAAAQFDASEFLKSGERNVFGQNGKQFPAEQGADNWTDDASKHRADVGDDILDDGHIDDGLNRGLGHDLVDGADVRDPVLNRTRTVPLSVTPSTLISTPQGARPIEDLCVGDEVVTRDNGVQKITWVGARGLTGVELRKSPHLNPVHLAKGSLGEGLPEHDMWLRPNHRVLVRRNQTALYFEDPDALVAAKHLTALQGISIATPRWARFAHIMFDQHQLILANGVWTESFQPDDYSLKGVGNAQRLELEELFTELDTSAGRASFVASRKSLKRYEAKRMGRE